VSPEPASGRARPPGAPQRRTLPHTVPWWVRPEQEIFFITVCCKPRIKNQLCTLQVALELFDSIEFRNQKGIWYAHLVVLMPDHLHALASFPPDGSMRKIIVDWKRFLGTNLRIDWQRDFFDHRLRRQESFGLKADYIRSNPVRAGLVGKPEAWPYFWVPDVQT